MIPAKGFRTVALNGEDAFPLDNSDNYQTVEDIAPIRINQVYGGGTLDGAINYSFVELLNPSDEEISLDRYSLQYFQNPDDQAEGWATLPLTGTIPANGTFLVAATGAEIEGARYQITEWDMAWENMTFSNRAGSFAVVYGQTALSAEVTEEEEAAILDLVGIQNSDSDTVYYSEGNSHVPGLSKQKAARRINFADTNENENDFEVLDYRASGLDDDELKDVKPRVSAEGSWAFPEEEESGGSADHLIINQTYGSGLLDNSGSVSHSFVELYNPTSDEVALDGYSLQIQNGADKDNEPTEWEKYDFDNGTIIEANHSFLIRLALAAPSARYQIEEADVDWPNGRTMSNRAYSVALVGHQDLLSKTISDEEMHGVIDLVGASNTAAEDITLNFEGAPLAEISKQKAARRIDFQDFDDNETDLESIDYRSSGISASKLEELKPRSTADGAWGMAQEETEEPEQPVTEILVPRTLTLSAYYDGAYHTLDTLDYYKMAFGETFGRFMDADSNVVRFDDNGTYGATNNPVAPVLSYDVSHASGQYNRAIEVKITTDSINTVMYTLDRSIPSETNGIEYTEPILIEDDAMLRIYIYNANQYSGALS
ncbi:MAG: lamin tail domain-containing protein [Clostridiales bacterium]|jgi:hypothetical protein|nr:lamin tail domain-containing protein [Clostridiales bacterium]